MAAAAAAAEGGECDLVTVVLKIDMHCNNCAAKVAQYVMRMPGVAAAAPDGANAFLTVKGRVDPCVLRSALEAKLRKKKRAVTVFGLTTHPCGSADDTPEEEVVTAEVVRTAVLRVGLHCDGCVRRVVRKLRKLGGVEVVGVDAEKGLVKVSGAAMDGRALARYLQRELGKRVEAVVEEEEDKEKGGNGVGGGEKDEKEKHEGRRQKKQFEEEEQEEGCEVCVCKKCTRAEKAEKKKKKDDNMEKGRAEDHKKKKCGEKKRMEDEEHEECEGSSCGDGGGQEKGEKCGNEEEKKKSEDREDREDMKGKKREAAKKEEVVAAAPEKEMRQVNGHYYGVGNDGNGDGYHGGCHGCAAPSRRHSGYDSAGRDYNGIGETSRRRRSYDSNCFGGGDWYEQNGYRRDTGYSSQIYRDDSPSTCSVM